MAITAFAAATAAAARMTRVAFAETVLTRASAVRFTLASVAAVAEAVVAFTVVAAAVTTFVTTFSQSRQRRTRHGTDRLLQQTCDIPDKVSANRATAFSGWK